MKQNVKFEEIVKQTRKSTNGARIDSIRTFQDFLIATAQPSLVSIGHSHGHATVLPINDLRGDAVLHYTKAEKAARCILASMYRLIDIMGWSEGIFNHISVIMLIF